MLIRTWATHVHVWVNNGGPAFDGELTAMRREPPPQFVDRNANLRLVGVGDPDRHVVKDASAAGGQARRFGSGKPDDHKLPFQMKIHDDIAPRNWGTMTLAKVPQDEGWHWHHVATAPITGNCGLWSNVYIWLPIGWGALPPPGNELEVWVSLKFTGPTYVKGSELPDQVLIDQVVTVPPQAEKNR